MDNFSKLIKSIRRNPNLFIGFIISFSLLGLMLSSVLFQSPFAQNLDLRLLPSGSSSHLLGTDHFGRDVLSRLATGSKISIQVGFIASGISLMIGVILGLISGYFGRRMDTIIMRFTDIMLAFPILLFLIAISAAFEPSLKTTMIAIGAVSWPPIARLMRSQVLSMKNREFVNAARSLGFNHFRIIIKHILPNCLAPILITFTLGISGAIMAEASLSFLGLGVQPPEPSWGAMINEGKDFLRVAPHLSIYPGIAIALAVLGFNLLGEGLRDKLDVKNR